MKVGVVMHLVCSVLAFWVEVYLLSGTLGSVRCNRMACAAVLSFVAIVWLSTALSMVVGIITRFRRVCMSARCRYAIYFTFLFSGLCVIAWYVLLCHARSNANEFYSDGLKVPSGLEIGVTAPNDHVAYEFPALMETNSPPFMAVTEPLHSCFGAVNPHEPGVLYVRVVEQTNSTEMRRSDVIRSGWSQKSEENFCFNIALGPNYGRKGKTYVVSYELWFRPDDGTQERMLLSKSYTTEGNR